MLRASRGVVRSTAGVPRILFLHNAPHLVDAYAKLPAGVIATDGRLDLGSLKHRCPDRAPQGDIDQPSYSPAPKQRGGRLAHYLTRSIASATSSALVMASCPKH